MVVLWVVLALVALVLLTSLICFYMAFYASRRPVKNPPEFDLPPGESYKPYHEKMTQWMKEVRQLPYEEMQITSFDGLQLHGKYYEYAPGAPVELMFHGYRGTAERDLCGGIQRSFSLGRSVLIVDQRTSGKSGGHVITFGAKESKDCLTWVEFMIKRFGPEVKIILCGISMGATTVLLAASRALPENVKGVLADCGYTSAKKIIKKVIRQLGLPAELLYPFVRLGAILYGGFDPKDADAEAALQKCRLPVIFFHGEADDYVPCEMSKANYAACPAVKKLVTMSDAGHGMCYLVDPEGYLTALREFAPNWGI